MYCPNCKRSFSESKCPVCGFSDGYVDRDKEKSSGSGSHSNNSKRWLWILLAVVAAIVLIVVIAAPSQEAEDGAAQQRIEDLLQSEEFTGMSHQEQVEAVESMLDDLYKEGLIQEQASYDTSSEVFSFQYQDGTGGGICMRDFDEEMNSGPPPVNSPMANAKVSAHTNEALEVVFFNAFEDTPFRRDFYNDLQAQWQSRGINTTVDTQVTVEDLTNLQKYDVVVFSSHGSTYNAIPALCLNENADASTKRKYADYLQTGAVVKVHYSTDGQDHYWVLPDFFSQCYKNGDLEGKIFCSESCCFFGSEDSSRNPVTSFADAILLRSAEAVIGYRNSVLAVYSRELITTALEMMFDEATFEKAVKDSIAIHGDSDKYADPESGKRVAYPLWYGNGSYVLAKEQQDQRAKDTAMEAYKKLLWAEQPLATASGYDILATHYVIFDMNRDGVPEIMLYSIDPDGPIPVFAVYTYRDEKIQQIADSVVTCTVSDWQNSTGDLCIRDNKQICYQAAKSSGANVSGVAGILTYDGQRVANESLTLGSHVHGDPAGASCQVLILNNEIVGGTRIGQ